MTAVEEMFNGNQEEGNSSVQIKPRLKLKVGGSKDNSVK
jgi:hypothetical protein|tara:strand:- start:717 stop:833 length:117 start_codon:yes stop_codon:yes gene_type:complete